jgi:transcriptional regulator with XRE-family HTH domain
MTLGAVALQAGIATSTLSRWESGKRLPSVPELGAVLTALSAGEAERRQALEQINAPRAVRELHKENEAMPVGGDLLWALRIRRGMTQADAARLVGATQSQVAKWERSEAWPDPARLAVLCQEWKASPKEFIALQTGRFRLGGTGDQNDVQDTAEAWEAQVQNTLFNAPPPLLDLIFLSLETRLWERRNQPWALPLLALAYDYHARAHLFHLHPERAGPWARRSLTFAGRYLPNFSIKGKFPGWGGSVVAHSAALATSGGQKGCQRAVAALEQQMPLLAEGAFRAWAMSELGGYYVRLGNVEAAIAISQTAIHLAYDSANTSDIEILFRQRDHAHLLFRLGRYAQALTVLDGTARLMHQSHDAHLRHLLLQAECLVGLGEKDTANHVFREVQNLLSQPQTGVHLRHLIPAAEAVYAQLHTPK